MTTEESARLAEIEARAGAATPGPLFAVVNDLIGGFSVSSRNEPASAFRWDRGDRMPADMLSEEDARFYAASREDVPWLAERVRAKDEAFAEGMRRAEGVWKELRDHAEQAEIERNEAREQAAFEGRQCEARLDEIAKAAGMDDWDYPGQIIRAVQEAREQLAAAIVCLKAWEPSVMSWCQRFPQKPIPEAVAAFAKIAPLMEKP